MKSPGKRSAGKPHAAIDEAGAGNVEMRAPVLDPTDEAGAGNVMRRAPVLDPTKHFLCNIVVYYSDRKVLRTISDEK